MATVRDGHLLTVAVLASVRERELGRLAELESLLREINAKVIFENAVSDGSGADLQERVEQALGIGQSAPEPKT